MSSAKGVNDNVRWAVSCVCWLLGLALVLAGFFGLDQVFYNKVSMRLQTPNPLDRDFYHLTKPLWITLRLVWGSLAGAMVMYFIVVATHARSWRSANIALVSVMCAALVADFAQAAIGRLRPDQADGQLAFTTPLVSLIERQGVCFPSGEAATAFALACVLSRLYPGGRAVFYACAVCTAGARLMNGAHFLSDVAAGAMAGVIIGRWVFAYLAARYALPLGQSHRRTGGGVSRAADTCSPCQEVRNDGQTYAGSRRVPGG